MSNASWCSQTDNENDVFYNKSWNIFTYYVYFKSNKVLNYNRFVDPNILGASRLVHSDLRIYRISFFLLDMCINVSVILKGLFADLGIFMRCQDGRKNPTKFILRSMKIF